MEMDGQIIGVEISSLVMQLNGMILMEMGTVTTGTTLTGIFHEIQIGLENLFSMLWSQTSVRIHRLQMLTMKGAPRVRGILTVTV
jgi:hypothetical protein